VGIRVVLFIEVERTELLPGAISTRKLMGGLTIDKILSTMRMIVDREVADC
jgi:hypothetical protein